MNRKEFILINIKNGVKLVKLAFRLVVLLATILLLYNAIFHSGPTRGFLIVILSIFLILAIVYFINEFINKIIKNIKSKLSEKTKFRLKIINEVFNAITPIIYGILLYYLWERDLKFEIILALYYIVQYVVKVINKNLKILK